jgi:hypothetical protein
MCWWCVDVIKTSIFDEVKNRPKTAILSLFFETLENSHFWPFFVCWRVLMISWCANNKFWWWHGVNDVWWCRWWRKKVRRGKKNDEKWPSAEPYKKHQNGARHGRRETAERKGHKERLWRDRVRMACLMSLNKQTPGNGTSSASVAMCEAFLETCAAYSHEWLIHAWDSWKQARASAAKCVRVS